MEATAIRAGPTMNFIAMATIAIRIPHAIMLGRDAINRPVEHLDGMSRNSLLWVLVTRGYWKFIVIPKLNIAIPSPPVDNILTDLSTMSGKFTPHLKQRKAL